MRKKFYYDLHLHSCLSPCGDREMTPPNLVGTAKLNGLDVIALTDHNTVKNCPAAIECGKEYGILVIPGMELTTAEEAHIICLFPDLDAAVSFEKEVDKRRMKIQNRPDIFGRQVVMNADEEEIEEVDVLLTAATTIGTYEVVPLVNEYGGVAFPAHIDRDSFSVTASLGMVSADMGFSAVEFSFKGWKEGAAVKLQGRYPENVLTLYNSDAHTLENIAQPKHYLELLDLDSSTVLSKLRQGFCSK